MVKKARTPAERNMKMLPAGSVRLYRFPPLRPKQDGQLVEPLPDYDQGYEQGRAQGWEEGHAEGRQDGFDQGQQQGFDQGYREGMEAGLLEGQQRGRQQLDMAVQPFARLRTQLEGLIQQRLAEQQTLIVELVEQVARQVIYDHLQTEPSQVLKLVNEALAQLPGPQDSIRIYLNPDDIQRLAAVDCHDCQGWAFEADPTLGIGDGRIESGHSLMELATEQRLQESMAVVQLALCAEEESVDA